MCECYDSSHELLPEDNWHSQEHPKRRWFGTLPPLLLPARHLKAFQKRNGEPRVCRPVIKEKP